LIIGSGDPKSFDYLELLKENIHKNKNGEDENKNNLENNIVEIEKVEANNNEKKNFVFTLNEDF
jgi:hypothetical protein